MTGMLILSSCQKKEACLCFAVSADYPPFEYMSEGQLKGFEIELAQKIGEELGKKVEFREMSFYSLLIAVQSGLVDAAVSTLTKTQERAKRFDFSAPYYFEEIVLLTPKDQEVKRPFSGRRIACQLGTTMEIWLKTHEKGASLVTVDQAGQAIEALKAGHVEAVLIDRVQAQEFVKNNPHLKWVFVDRSKEGYGFAFKQGSALKDQVNKALTVLKTKGILLKLKKKYKLSGE